MKQFKFAQWFLLLAFVFIAASCGGDDTPETPKSSEAKITSFKLDLSFLETLEDQSIKEGVSVEVVGEEIIVNLPFGLYPDTLRKVLASNAPILELSTGASVQPASGEVVKFNTTNPVYYYVTAEDGISKTAYKVRFFEKAETGYGYKETAWTKKGDAFTDKFTSNNEKSFALTPDYVILQNGGIYNSVPLQLVKVSLLDGTEKGYVNLKYSVTVGDKKEEKTIEQIRSLSGDLKGGFIGCNLAAPGEDFKVWAWDDHAAAPRELIKWNVDGFTSIGTVPDWAKNFAGRRIFMVGDLKTKAYIYTYICYSLDIVRWEVTNGIASSTPEFIKYIPGGTMARFENWASIVPLKAEANSDFIVNAANAGSEVSYVDGKTRTVKMTAGAVATPKGIASYLEFNGAKYYIPLNTEAYKTPHEVNARVYDYTNVDTTEKMANAWWKSPQGTIIQAVTGLANGDASGCVAAIADADGLGFKVVALGTGCGVVVDKYSTKKEMAFDGNGDKVKDE